MYDLILNLVSVLVFAFVGYKVYLSLKRWYTQKKKEFKNENAFKGFVRDQKTKANFWGMVRAYRERAIKKLGWNEE